MGRRMVAATLALLLTMFGCSSAGDVDSDVDGGDTQAGASAGDGGVSGDSTSGDSTSGNGGNGNSDGGNGNGTSGQSGDTSGVTGQGGDTSGDGGDASAAPSANTSAATPAMRQTSARTCHNRSTAGGNSDVEVTVEVTGIPDGTTISTDWRVNSDPPPRVSTGIVTDGKVTFVIAAFQEKEVGIIGNAAIGSDPEGPDTIATDEVTGFTVADIGDPETEC